MLFYVCINSRIKEILAVKFEPYKFLRCKFYVSFAVTFFSVLMIILGLNRNLLNVY